MSMQAISSKPVSVVSETFQRPREATTKEKIVASVVTLFAIAKSIQYDISCAMKEARETSKENVRKESSFENSFILVDTPEPSPKTLPVFDPYIMNGINYDWARFIVKANRESSLTGPLLLPTSVSPLLLPDPSTEISSELRPFVGLSGSDVLDKAQKIMRQRISFAEKEKMLNTRPLQSFGISPQTLLRQAIRRR